MGLAGLAQPPRALTPRRPRPFLLPLLASVVLLRGATGWIAAGRLTDRNLVDPGQWADAGNRILAGRWPYRDWTGLYGPALYALAAGTHAVLGRTWHAARFLLEVLSPAACLALAALAGALTLPGRAWPVAFLAATALLGLDACYWSPALRVWWPLAAVAAVAGGPESPLAWLAALAACGVAPLVSPETGGAAIAAAFGYALALRAALLPAPAGPAAVVAAVAAPLGLAVALAPAVMRGYWRAAADLAVAANWIWGVPLPGPMWPGRRLLFLLPPAAALACLALAGWRLWSRTGGAARRAAAADLALAGFAVLVQRAALGRADVPHLLFALPPVMLCTTRAFAGVAAPRLGAVLAIALLLPYAALSAREGQLGRAWSATRADTTGWVAVADQDVAGPADFAGRLNRITAVARAAAGPGGRMLSLPGPVYAALLGRADALPVATPELLGAEPDGGRARLAGSASPDLIVLDPALALPWDDYYQAPRGPEPEDGRLGWSTPADEAATRELRAWLRIRYRPLREVDGAWLLARRAAARPERPVRTIARLQPDSPALAALARGDIARFPLAGEAGDEVRLTVACHYRFGAGALAKTLLRMTAVGRDGRIWPAVLPVPPAALARELRFAVPRTPLARLELEVGGAGSLNPAPATVAIPAIVVVRVY